MGYQISCLLKSYAIILKLRYYFFSIFLRFICTQASSRIPNKSEAHKSKQVNVNKLDLEQQNWLN